MKFIKLLKYENLNKNIVKALNEYEINSSLFLDKLKKTIKDCKKKNQFAENKNFVDFKFHKIIDEDFFFVFKKYLNSIYNFIDKLRNSKFIVNGNVNFFFRDIKEKDYIEKINFFDLFDYFYNIDNLNQFQIEIEKDLKNSFIDDDLKIFGNILSYFEDHVYSFFDFFDIFTGCIFFELKKKIKEKRYKFFIKEKKIKQKELSNLLELSQPSISAIGNKTQIDKLLALALNSVYNLNPDWLLHGKEPMYLPPNLNFFSKKTAELIKIFEKLPDKYQAEITATAQDQEKKHQDFLREQEEYERKHREDVKRMYDNRIVPKQMVKIPIVGTVKAGIPSFSEERIEEYHFYADMEGKVAKNPDKYYYMRIDGDSMSECRMWHGDIILVQKDIIARTGDIIIARVGEEITVKKVRFILDNKRVELIPCNPNYETMTYPGEEVSIEGVVINIDWSRKR